METCTTNTWKRVGYRYCRIVLLLSCFLLPSTILNAQLLRNSNTDDGRFYVNKVHPEKQSSLEIVDFIDATEAFAFAKSVMTSDYPDARPLVVWGYESDYEMYHYKSVPLENDGVFFPSGKSDYWTVAYYEDTDSTLHLLDVDASGVIDHEIFNISDLPSDERPPVPLSTVRSLPDNFISSVNAVSTALANGLEDLLAQMPSYAQIEYDYDLNAFYFEHPDLFDANSNPFWTIYCYAFAINPDNYSGYTTESWYLIDAVTGAFIDKHEETHEWGDLPALELLHTNPSHLSAGIPLNSTIRFNFDDVIYFPSASLDMAENSNWVIPSESIEIQNVSISEDHQSISYDVIHQPDTDYSWIMMGIQGIDGSQMDKVEIVSYTTKPTVSVITVRGHLIVPDNFYFPPDSRIVVALLDNADFYYNPPPGTPSGIKYAGTLTNDGTWLIENVRPGNYYVAAFLFDLSDGYADLYGGGFYENDQGEPGVLSVQSGSLTDIDLTLQDSGFMQPDPVDLLQVFGEVESDMSDIDSDSELVMVWAREQIDLPDHPHGKSPEWMIVYFNSQTEVVNLFLTHGNQIASRQTFPISDVPVEERMPMDAITFVTEPFINSTEALAVAMDNGLRDLLDELPEGDWSDARLNYHLSGFYSIYPDILNSESNPYWLIDVHAQVRDRHFQIIHNVKGWYFIDAYSGDFISSEVITSADPDSESGADLPANITLHQNYPNPFNPSTTVSWELSSESHVSIRVFDLLGRTVATLTDDRYPAGVHSIPFDAGSLPSGVYIYRLEAGDVVQNRKMTLVK